MSPETYRITVLRAAEEGNWAEVERLSARYGWSLLRDIAFHARKRLLARPLRRRERQSQG